jgi:transcriptional regulator with XRE-family HTH domain
MISGQCLRLLRLMKGIKQETIAKRLGISQPAYSKLENSNKLREERVQKVLNALSSTWEDLKKVSSFTPVLLTYIIGALMKVIVLM